jgi:hypothetical protein
VEKGDPRIHISDIENVELVFPDGLRFNSAKLMGPQKDVSGSIESNHQAGKFSLSLGPVFEGE